MKKKMCASGGSPGQQPADFMVGQVSGSLQKSSTASGSLSALFSPAATPSSILFQPAPECQTQSEEEPPQVKGHPIPQQQQKKKPPKPKSAADQKLEDREAGLQNADEDERSQTARKRKPEPEPEELGVEHWVKRRQLLKAQKEEEALKARRTVFVGNLPLSCTRKELRSLFKDAGTIESIRFRSLVREDPSMSRKVAAIKRKAHPKKQSMNGYVVFKEESGVSKALQRNGLEIQKDFHIRVDRAGGAHEHDHRRSVFVGNLPLDLGEEALRRHFEPCGGVDGVRLVRDGNSGLGKGFGYVLFQSVDSVQLALELDSSRLEGRAIRVRRSVSKQQQQQKKKKAGGPGGPGGPRRPKTSSHGPKNTFKGETAKLGNKKNKKKKKKKLKPKKQLHI